jgi:hypothetical protein
MRSCSISRRSGLAHGASGTARAGGAGAGRSAGTVAAGGGAAQARGAVQARSRGVAGQYVLPTRRGAAGGSVRPRGDPPQDGRIRQVALFDFKSNRVEHDAALARCGTVPRADGALCACPAPHPGPGPHHHQPHLYTRGKGRGDIGGRGQGSGFRGEVSGFRGEVVGARW